jgi:hypothetical protein
MAEVGKPLKFATRESLQKRIDEYFEYANANNKPYSIAKLAVYLECDRQTIYNYDKKEEYFDIIKEARRKCIAMLEEKMLEHGTPGQIFVAKNYGYTDRQEIVSENTNINKNVSEMTTEEAEKRISELMEKLNKK